MNLITSQSSVFSTLCRSCGCLGCHCQRCLCPHESESPGSPPELATGIVSAGKEPGSPPLTRCAASAPAWGPSPILPPIPPVLAVPQPLGVLLLPFCLPASLVCMSFCSALSVLPQAQQMFTERFRHGRRGTGCGHSGTHHLLLEPHSCSSIQTKWYRFSQIQAKNVGPS